MMFEQIIKKFNPVLYVQIWENRIKVTDINSGNRYDEKPLMALQKNNKGKEVIIAVGNRVDSMDNQLQTTIINPFSHPRTLISNFVVAEKILQHIIDTMFKPTFLKPLIVVHPMETMKGGITQIEFRAFKELALGAGARDSTLYQGSELNIEYFDYARIKNYEKEP